MKTKSILYAVLFSIGAVVFSNCSGKKEQDHDHETATADEHASGSNATDEIAAPQFEVDAAFQTQLAGVFSSYVSLKEAFVASNTTDVKAKANATKQALAGVDMKLLEGAAHHDWMNYVGGIEASLKKIQTTDDIEAQRQSFSTLTDNLYKSIKAYGLGGTSAFYEFCPMAFNDKGGYWLSDSETIRNPYFGDKMLKCGSVEEKLQ